MVGAPDAAGMSVIVLLIAAGGLVSGGFLCAFIWAVQTGQFDDTCTPPLRVLGPDGGRCDTTPAPSSERHLHDHADR
jgi:cbb3-type cytochrome oxidase maturation protein